MYNFCITATLIGAELQNNCAVLPSFWGKGLATSAVQVVANIIFDKLPHLERLETLSEVDSVASHKSLHNAGFNKLKKLDTLRKYCTIQGKGYPQCHL